MSRGLLLSQRQCRRDDNDNVNTQQLTLWSDAFQAEKGGGDFDTSDEWTMNKQ
jgi:hypothetical protein